eukprot:s589_g6.t1
MLRSYRVDAVVIGDGSPLNVGTWLIWAGFVSSMIGLIVSPYLPSRRSDMAFVDCTCVHQVDQVLMQQGINNIGGFLAAAKELRVLWSSTYLSRLWCVFELAAYRKVNPTGKITLSPLFIKRITFQIFLWLEALTAGFWYSRVVRSGRMELSGFVLFALLVLGCLAIPLIHSLRHSYLSKKILISSLDSFDVRKVECLVDSDRLRIHAAIVSWYGSLDAFSEYVRGPFREDVLGPCAPLAASPSAARAASLAEERGGAHAEYLRIQLEHSLGLAFALGPGFVGFPGLRLRALCDTKTSRWQHYLLTMAIVLMMWFVFMLGSLCAIGSSQHSIEMVLVWTAASVLFLVIFFVYQLIDAVNDKSLPLWVRVIRVTGNELLLLLTVLCHEMGHGTMARRCGGTIAQVLLWPFGGICFTTRPQGRGAREKLVDDLWIVGAGPATHFPMSAAWFALLASYVAMCSHVIFPPSWKYLVPFGSAMPPCMAAGYTGRRAKDSGV